MRHIGLPKVDEVDQNQSSCGRDGWRARTWEEKRISHRVPVCRRVGSGNSGRSTASSKRFRTGRRLSSSPEKPASERPPCGSTAWPARTARAGTCSPAGRSSRRRISPSAGSPTFLAGSSAGSSTSSPHPSDRPWSWLCCAPRHPARRWITGRSARRRCRRYGHWRGGGPWSSPSTTLSGSTRPAPIWSRTSSAGSRANLSECSRRSAADPTPHCRSCWIRTRRARGSS